MIGIGVGGVVLAGIGGVFYKKNMDRNMDRTAAEQAEAMKFANVFTEKGGKKTHRRKGSRKQKRGTRKN